MERTLALLGPNCSAVREFFHRNPETLEGEDWECPIGRYLHNVLGLNPIVGEVHVACGAGVLVRLPPGVRAFLDWYENEFDEPNLEDGCVPQEGIGWVA